MKLFYAATVLCLIALPMQRAVAQGDHAPTVEQCRADRDVWLYEITEYENAETDRIESGSPNHTHVNGLTLAQLNDRTKETLTCAHVDPSREDLYNHLGSAYTDARKDRYVAFIRRHGLNSQLFREDNAGVR
jgi:hypothetical protein